MTHIKFATFAHGNDQTSAARLFIITVMDRVCAHGSNSLFKLGSNGHGAIALSSGYCFPVRSKGSPFCSRALSAISPALAVL
jgi:hypothetical protein